MALVRPAANGETELPTHRVTHDSMCATKTYDGELTRWYAMVDPDYRVQYPVCDRGGCCVRSDGEGNVTGVSEGKGRRSRTSGSDDSLPDAAMVVALAVGLVSMLLVTARLLGAAFAWLFSMCCVLAQG